MTPLEDAEIGVDIHLEQRETAGEIFRMLESLPKNQREVVVLRYLADWSERDVALSLGVSAGAVKSHASRGLAALRQHLDAGHAEGVRDVRASG